MTNDQVVFPAVAWESCEWLSDPATAGPMSRRARMRARGPYQAAVIPRIADRSLPLPPTVTAAAEDALMAIARFDAELSTAGDAREPQTTGEIAPLASVLLRTESASSSQIENVTAGAKALAMATLQRKAGANARLVAANVDAMQRATSLAEELTEANLLAAHAALMAHHEYAQPGRFRDGQVWIGSNAPTPHTATFVPPRAEAVPEAMQDLLTFCDRTDLPVLVQVAVAHAQFETIHPFADGNGRVGRVLVHALLRRTGTTQRMTVPVSAGLLTDTAAYFKALTAYREGRPEAIVEQFSAAAFQGVKNGRQLVDDLRAVSHDWQSALTVRRDAAAHRALAVLLRQPAVTVGYLQHELGISQPAARNAIDQLVGSGILAPANSDRRNRVWTAPRVIAVLDGFAARVKRV